MVYFSFDLYSNLEFDSFWLAFSQITVIYSTKRVVCFIFVLKRNVIYCFRRSFWSNRDSFRVWSFWAFPPTKHRIYLLILKLFTETFLQYFVIFDWSWSVFLINFENIERKRKTVPGIITLFAHITHTQLALFSSTGTRTGARCCLTSACFIIINSIIWIRFFIIGCECF